ncbi:MAG: type II toxin-antitoxin system RelE/ParE family toxin [Nevskia sp.]|nr:type II toxin-antitoxin system RelE/ParE family toxin [Nevskia sp.]
MAARLPPIQKLVTFEGTSQADLRAFPDDAKFDLGHQLDQVQRGLLPDDWKAMPAVGPGVMELRCQDKDGWYRVAYVAKFAESIYVLHAFQKKTNATSKQDVDLIKSRLSAVIAKRGKRVKK